MRSMLNLIASTVSKACLAFLLFCTGYPSSRNLLLFGVLHRLKVFWNYVLIKSENMSPLTLSSYCSHKTIPFDKLPQWNMVIFLPSPLCKPSFFNRQAMDGSHGPHHMMRLVFMLKSSSINVEWNTFFPELMSQYFGNFTGKFTSLFKIDLFL